jgi:hypothetical protein
MSDTVQLGEFGAENSSMPQFRLVVAEMVSLTAVLTIDHRVAQLAGTGLHTDPSPALAAVAEQ